MRDERVSADYQQKAIEILKKLETDFLLPSGLISLQKIKGVLDPRNVVSDLGDIIPFSLEYGRDDFVYGQIQIIKQQYPDGLMASETPMLGISGLVKSYEYTDLLLGLAAYQQRHQVPENSAYIQMIADRAVQLFALDGRWSSVYAPQIKYPLPLRDFRDGMFIELLLTLGQLLQTDRYQKAIINLFSKLTADEDWQALSIWPAYCLTIGPRKVSRIVHKKYRRYEFVKANSNTIFGLYALYQASGRADVLEAIRKSINGSLEIFGQSKGVAMVWERSRGASDVRLTAGFTMIELLCDGNEYAPDGSWIDQAQAIADFWLNQQSDIGLFPTVPGGETAFIDSNTDMIIALCKLSERTNNTHYAEAAWHCLAGMESVFVAQGFPLHCCLSDGKPTVDVVKSKFIALFLKVYILKQHYLQGKSIYSSSTLFELLKDR